MSNLIEHGRFSKYLSPHGDSGGVGKYNLCKHTCLWFEFTSTSIPNLSRLSQSCYRNSVFQYPGSSPKLDLWVSVDQTADAFKDGACTKKPAICLLALIPCMWHNYSSDWHTATAPRMLPVVAVFQKDSWSSSYVPADVLGLRYFFK